MSNLTVKNSFKWFNALFTSVQLFLSHFLKRQDYGFCNLNMLCTLVNIFDGYFLHIADHIMIAQDGAITSTVLINSGFVVAIISISVSIVILIGFVTNGVKPFINSALFSSNVII